MVFRLTNNSGGPLGFRGKPVPDGAKVIADELTPEQIVSLQGAGWNIIDSETGSAPDTTGAGGFNTGSDGFVVVPNDNKDFRVVARALYVGGTGDVTLITDAGTELPFVGVPTGTTLQISARRVKATGTTATNIIGLT